MCPSLLKEVLTSEFFIFFCKSKSSLSLSSSPSQVSSLMGVMHIPLSAAYYAVWVKPMSYLKNLKHVVEHHLLVQNASID